MEWKANCMNAILLAVFYVCCNDPISLHRVFLFISIASLYIIIRFVTHVHDHHIH